MSYWLHPEAENSTVVLANLQNLKGIKLISNVQILSQQTQLQDPDKPVRFEFALEVRE